METEQLIQPVAASLNIEPSQVRNTLKLLEEGNTVPFIARYRKEMTKGLDEEQILFIQQQVQYLSNLEKRKEDVLRIIETQGKLTEDLRKQVLACTKLSQVDDIYRPYAPPMRQPKDSRRWRIGLLPARVQVIQQFRPKSMLTIRFLQSKKRCRELKIFWQNGSAMKQNCVGR